MHIILELMHGLLYDISSTQRLRLIFEVNHWNIVSSTFHIEWSQLCLEIIP